MRPPSSDNSPMMLRKVVVLPAPLRPINTVVRDGMIVKLTLRSTRCWSMPARTCSNRSISRPR